MRDHEIVLTSERGQRATGDSRVGPLILGRERLSALQQRVPAQCDDDAHAQLPRVATMTALIVCIRFSASSNTIDAGDSNTSSVTSSDSRPYFSRISWPTCVSELWNAGRQCMNLTSGFPVSDIVFAFTWYGSSSLIRSAHTSSASPIDTHTY